MILSGYKSAAHVLPRHENTAKHMDRMIIEELPTPEKSAVPRTVPGWLTEELCSHPDSKTEQEP